MENKKTMDWILRFIKGMFIGSGAILPGVSGGALAAVFGIYERLISFLANITKNFKENVLYFIPVGLGGIVGIFLLSFAISFFLGAYETQMLWFFVGCIIGTLPTLWRQAGKKGRKPYHFAIMGGSFILGLLFLIWGEGAAGGSFPQNTFTWLIAGAIMGLGFILPGLSPSNFLVYLGMYKPMTDGIKAMDFSVIIPIIGGVVLIVIAFSKLMEWVLKKAYAGMFHCIFGVVIASTLMIVPTEYNYFSMGTVGCVIAIILGTILAAWMCRLEDKYKPKDE